MWARPRLARRQLNHRMLISPKKFVQRHLLNPPKRPARRATTWPLGVPPTACAFKLRFHDQYLEDCVRNDPSTPETHHRDTTVNSELLNGSGGSSPLGSVSQQRAGDIIRNMEHTCSKAALLAAAAFSPPLFLSSSNSSASMQLLQSSRAAVRRDAARGTADDALTALEACGPLVFGGVSRNGPPAWVAGGGRKASTVCITHAAKATASVAWTFDAFISVEAMKVAQCFVLPPWLEVGGRWKISTAYLDNPLRVPP